MASGATSAGCETLIGMQPNPAYRIESKSVPHRYRGRRHAAVARGKPHQPTAVVVHWSGGWGELDSLVSYLRRAGADESYNYAIDRSARIGELVPSTDGAWHAGDGKLPPADRLLAEGFVPAREVPYVRRVTNLLSVGVCMCNVGYLSESLLVEARNKRALVHSGIRHHNPRSKSDEWEGYRDQSVLALGTHLLPLLVQRHPTLKIILGHEDVTNYDAMGTKGSKVDPGPAFPWDRLPLAELGLARVRYDFDRHGWEVVEPPANTAPDDEPIILDEPENDCTA